MQKVLVNVGVISLTLFITQFFDTMGHFFIIISNYFISGKLDVTLNKKRTQIEFFHQILNQTAVSVFTKIRFLVSVMTYADLLYD